VGARRGSYRALVFPEIFEAAGGQFGVPDSVGDVPMAQVLLDRARVVALVG